MKKIIALITILILGIGFYTIQNKNPKTQNSDDKPTVKIGAVMALTGSVAEVGNNSKVAMQIALDEYKDNNINFELIFEDDAFSSAKTATVANKLINLDKVNAIISWSATSGSVISPIADRANILHIGITNDTNIAKGDNNFIHFTSSASESRKIIEIAKNYNAKKMAVFVMYQTGLQHTADELEIELKKNGIEFERVNFSSDLRDFNTMIEKAALQDFDLWYIAATPPGLDIFLNNFFAKNINKPITSVSGFTFSNRKELIEGIIYVDAPDGKDELREQVKAITGSENSFSIGFSYDAVKIIIKLYNDFYLKNNRLPTTEELSNELSNLKDFEGAVGKLNILDGGVIEAEAVFKKIINNKPVTVEE